MSDYDAQREIVELRAILLDLIVDLRDMHADGDVCSSLDAADRAEARLKGLNDE